MNKLLVRFPGKSLHQIGVLLLGIWVTGNTLNILWPNAQEIIKGEQIIRKEQLK